MTAWDLLPAVRDLFSKMPEARFFEPAEVQTLLWSLGYTEDLADEAAICAAMEVARGDWPSGAGWAA